MRVLALAAMLAITAPAFGSEDPSAAIRAALEGWRDDFNAGRAEHICGLFSAELLYDFQGLPEQNYTQLCDRLHRALSTTERRFHYGLHIKEIIVSGDLAVARIVWNSTVAAGDKSETEDEPGIDVFRRQSDGAWRIIRYIAYPVSTSSR